VSVFRWAVTLALVVLALVLQVSLFPHFAVDGVVPNLCLLVVVATALVRGPEQAAVLGFVAGVLLDLAPPADHVAGRWALALVIVGYVAGRVRPETGTDLRLTATSVVATVAASSFVGTSVYAISGLLLQDPVVSVGDLLPVILLGVVWDVLLTPLVLPGLMRLLGALEPDRAHV
jgi:rod shape-determining protein MreD